MDQPSSSQEEETKPPKSQVSEYQEAEITKSNFLYVLGDKYRGSSVIIEPYCAELATEEVFLSWLDKATQFHIRKARSGKSIAVLQFENKEVGNTALQDMRVQLAAKSKTDLNINHPVCSDTIENVCQHMYMDKLLNTHKPEEESVFGKQIILENVADSIGVDRIRQAFPQCINITDFRKDIATVGVLTVEFSTREEVEEILSKQRDVQINGTVVLLAEFDLANTCNKKYTTIRTRADQRFKPLKDDLRINMCKAYKKLEDERTQLFNRTDIFSQDKNFENTRLCSAMRSYLDHLLADTRRRHLCSENTDIPEQSNQTIAPVQRLLEMYSLQEFTPLQEQVSPHIQELLSKAGHKASVKLSLLDKIKSVAEERNKLAQDVALLPENTDEVAQKERNDMPAKDQPHLTHETYLVPQPIAQRMQISQADNRYLSPSQQPRNRPDMYSNVEGQSQKRARIESALASDMAPIPGDMQTASIAEVKALLVERLRQLEELQMKNSESQY